LIDRFLFRPSSPDTREYYKLIDASSAGVDSFGNYSGHTTAQDVLKRGKSFFTANDPKGLMQKRVGAEVSIAAGLEQVCVGKTGQDAIDLLVKYAHDSKLRTSVEEYIDENIKENRGLFCIKRVPCGWKAALKFCLEAQKGKTATEPGDNGEVVLPVEKPLDFKIPFEGLAASVYANHEAGIEKAILRKLVESSALETGSREAKVLLFDMLQGIKLEAKIQFIELAGEGTFNNVIRCRTSTGQFAALKISRTSRPEDRIHNDPLLREAVNVQAWDRRTHRSDVNGLLPKLLYLFARGTSCLGTSRPDKDGKVFVFLLQEFIDGETLNMHIGVHKKRWQQEGTLSEDLRLNILQPLSQGVFCLCHFDLACMDIKFDNIIVRKNGQDQGKMVFIDMGLGHTFTRSCELPNAQGDAYPCLLNRRCSSIALSTLERLPKGRLIGVGRKSPGALIRCITRKEMAAFLLRAEKTGLGNLAAGAMGFGAPKGIIARKTGRSRCGRAPRRAARAGGRPCPRTGPIAPGAAGSPAWPTWGVAWTHGVHAKPESQGECAIRQE
jgi:hypothetical protein